MARCPLCRARLAGAATCPRCGADLASAQAAGSQAEHDLKQALAWLAAGDHRQAAMYISQARRLRRTPLADALADWLKASERPEPRRADQNAPTIGAAARRLQSQPVEKTDSGFGQPTHTDPDNTAGTPRSTLWPLRLWPRNR